MPNITIEGPVLKDTNRKRALVKDLTEAATQAYGLPAKTIIVLIKENTQENVGVGGQLLIDRIKS